MKFQQLPGKRKFVAAKIIIGTDPAKGKHPAAGVSFGDHHFGGYRLVGTITLTYRYRLRYVRPFRRGAIKPLPEIQARCPKKRWSKNFFFRNELTFSNRGIFFS